MAIESTWRHALFQTLSPLESGVDHGLIETVSAVAGKILFLPVAMVGTVIESACILLDRWITPKAGFSAIAQDSTLWETARVDDINLTSIKRFGVATSHYQYGGAAIYPDSIWNTETVPHEGKKTLAELTQGGIDIYEDIDKVIATLQSAGMNTFRCSVPETLWPNEDRSISGLHAFKGKLQALKDAGISVTLTLHHFSHPKHFEDKGGFFNEENRADFARWAGILAQELGDVVDEWCTINEPAVFAVSSYFRGVFPPCEINYEKMADLMVGLIKTHNASYSAIKRARPDACVGFSHQMIRFESYSDLNPITQGVAHQMTHLFSTALLRFYETGTFDISIPCILKRTYTDPLFPEHRFLDVMQLQCYTRPLIGMFTEGGIVDSTHYPHESMTKMPFREDPAAIYCALKEVSRATGKPVSITEMGISTDDEAQRKRYFQRAMYAVSEAIKEGVEVPSLHVWAFHGSGHVGAYHEWNEDPDEQNFGVFRYSATHEPHEKTPAADELMRLFSHAVQPIVEAA